MLTEWSLENFKAFNGRHEFKLAPLTILCGANSSGKSTFVQSLLLIKQTFEFSPDERVIALNGPLVRLGAFSDIVNYDSREKNETPYIGIGWLQRVDENQVSSSRPPYWPNEERLCATGMDFLFDTSGPGSDHEVMELQPSLREARVHADFQTTDDTEHSANFSISRNSGRGRKIQYKSSSFDKEFVPSFKIVHVDVETKETVLSLWSGSTLISCETKHFFPYSPVIRFDKNKSFANDFAAEIAGGRVRRRVRTSQTRLPTEARIIIEQAIEASFGAGPRADEIKFLVFKDEVEGLSFIDSVIRRIRATF